MTSTEENPSIIYGEAGSYLVSLSIVSTQGCTSSYAEQVNVDPVISSLKESDLARNWNVYPNPSNGRFWIDLEQTDSGNVFIYDSNGRLLLQRIINTGTLDLDLSGWNPGIYWVQLRSEGLSSTRKIIIQ